MEESRKYFGINTYIKPRYTKEISPIKSKLTKEKSLIDRLPVIPHAHSRKHVRHVQEKTRNIQDNSTKIRRNTLQSTAAQTLLQRPKAFSDMQLKKCYLRAYFRRIIKLVLTLCRVCIAIRRYAVNKTDSCILIEFQNILRPPSSDNLPDPSTNNEGPYFNKHVYSVQNNHTFPAWARILCTKPPPFRKLGELEKLRSYLRGHVTFAQFDYDTQMILCEHVVYNRYDKKRIILNQGDVPEYYYIMVSGTVYVNISHRDINTGVDITETVDELHGHSSFGATGLIYNTKRTASVVCDSFVEVLLLESDVFKAHCAEFLTKQHENQKSFLYSHEIFRSWSTYKIKLLSYDIKCRFYRAGKIIDVDAYNSKYIFFVMEGSVDVLYKKEMDENGWLHSEKLNRHVGVLAGNRIRAPLPCNLSGVLLRSTNSTPNITTKLRDISKTERCYTAMPSMKNQNIKVLLVSNGATILYIPRSRFQDVAPKNFLKTFDGKPEFVQLSDDDYEREKRKAVRWMEYRERTTCETVKFKQKMNDVIIPTLIHI